MIYDVEIGGRTRRVAVTRHGQSIEVSVDGRAQAASVSVINGVWSLLLSDVPAPGDQSHITHRSHEVSIADTPGGALSIHVNGILVNATVAGARGAWARRGQDGSVMAKGPLKILAPMPGKVLKVLVKVGDEVAAKQGVVVVEAMKMENELKAPRAGTVKEVRAVEGASVEAGSVLVIVE